MSAAKMAENKLRDNVKKLEVSDSIFFAVPDSE